MGYRHYFYSIPKTELEEIKKCKTNKEYCDWAESKGYKVDRYDEEPWLAPYNLCNKEIYEFGKYVDWAFEMQEKNESIFGSEELIKQYEDYTPVICTQDDFLFVINKYKENVIKYYKGLLEENKYSKLSFEERWKHHIEGQIMEWDNNFGIYPINIDLSKERINDSWLYEYAIFELVRQYKIFDWEHNALVLIGW